MWVRKYQSPHDSDKQQKDRISILFGTVPIKLMITSRASVAVAHKAVINTIKNVVSLSVTILALVVSQTHAVSPVNIQCVKYLISAGAKNNKQQNFERAVPAR